MKVISPEKVFLFPDLGYVKVADSYIQLERELFSSGICVDGFGEIPNQPYLEILKYGLVMPKQTKADLGLPSESTAQYFVTPATKLKTLADYLINNKKSIDIERIQKFMFQLIFSLAKLQIDYGLQHNDVFESNILIEEMESESKIVYEIQGDKFEVVLGIGDLRVVLFDWDGANVNLKQKHNIKGEIVANAALPIEMYPDMHLLQNAPIEEIYRKKIQQPPESDMFRIGHVLLTLLLHGRQGYLYDKTLRNVHMCNPTKEEIDLVNSMKNVTANIQFYISDTTEMEASGFTTKSKQTNFFLIRMKQLQKFFGDTYQFDQTTAWGKYYNDIDISALSSNFMDKYKGEIDSASLQLLKKLMNFDTEKRGKFGIYKSYCLLAPLYHYYFKTFRLEPGNIIVPTFTIEKILQPGIYQGDAFNDDKLKHVIKTFYQSKPTFGVLHALESKTAIQNSIDSIDAKDLMYISDGIIDTLNDKTLSKISVKLKIAVGLDIKKDIKSKLLEMRNAAFPGRLGGTPLLTDMEDIRTNLKRIGINFFEQMITKSFKGTKQRVIPMPPDEVQQYADMLYEISESFNQLPEEYRKNYTNVKNIDMYFVQSTGSTKQIIEITSSVGGNAEYYDPNVTNFSKENRIVLSSQTDGDLARKELASFFRVVTLRTISLIDNQNNILPYDQLKKKFTSTVVFNKKYLEDILLELKK